MLYAQGGVINCLKVERGGSVRELNDMKVFLTNVPDTHVGQATSGWDLSPEDIGFFPPVGLMYLAAALRQHGGHEIMLVDRAPQQLSGDDIVNLARDFQPGLVGLTTYTPTFYDALELTKKLRAALPKAVIVWGGPHTTAFPQESMTHPEVDYLVQGEAEEIFPRMVDALERGEPLDDMEGLVFRRDGRLVFTGKPGYIQDIDALPFPALDLLDWRRYFNAIGTGQVVATICSSRGCPFHCTYCNRPYSTYRARSIENIIAEMQVYHEMGIREFFFFDDLFNITPKRVKELSQAVLDKGWRIDWTFRGRVDAVDEDMMALAKRSGCRQILFGVEDGTDEGLKLIKKKITIAQVKRAMRLARRNGIITSTNWLIGLPHHRTSQDVLNLLRTAIEVDSDYAQFNILRAYHGTEIFEDGVAKGLFGADVWRNYVLDPTPSFEEPIWEEHLSRDELSKLLQTCYRRFYYRPLPILRKVASLRRWRQFVIYFKGALKLLGFAERRGQAAAV